MDEHRGVARPVVAIAGSTGFVGRALMRELQSWYKIVALTRLSVKESHRRSWTDDTGIEWRRCDLFSLTDAEEALQGVNYAFYLVHSMMPSARLTQGKFQDMDLILADNFARAAAKAGIKQIIYLGGLVPDAPNLSLHLRSRLEVENTLGAHGVPVTALRAGLVIGANGSTSRILVRLAEKYRFMVFPRWMMSLTHPIALPDIINILHYCMGNPKTFNESFDVGGPDVMTYKELILTVAKILNRKCHITDAPFFPTWLASIMLSITSASPLALVKPLVESLKHPMVAKDRRLQEEMKLPGMPFVDAVKLAISAKEPRSKIKPPIVAERRKILSVRSVQRLIMPPGKDADWVALHYSRWLPKLFPVIIKVKVDQLGCYFYVRFLRRSFLDLTFSHESSSKDLALYYITGGFLAKLNQLPHRGRLEFRAVSNNRYVLAAIHYYVPTIPWYLYNITQALLHVWVMNKYGKHLERLAKKTSNDGLIKQPSK